MGFISSWKKYGDTDEGRLFTTFLQQGRNQRKNVKLFMKIRKVLLKNINQKILQEIKLNHCIISIILRRRSHNHSHVGFTDF